MDNGPEPNGWNKWSMWVLKELERLAHCFDNMDRRIDTLEQKSIIDESANKKRTRSSAWGVLGGGGLVAIIELIRYLIERFGGK